MAGFPPKKNTAFTFEIELISQADTDIFKTSPTLAAGDIQVSKDGAQYANLATFPPTEILLSGGGASGSITVTLTSTEMNADRIKVLFHDAAGNEWQDTSVEIFTDTAQVSSAVLGATQGAITWAQQKIVANVANEGALDIRNSNAAGHGTLNDGGNVGLYNSGANTGQYNFGTADYGIQAGGGTADIFGDITGDLTGNITGNITGDLTGDIIGNLDGTIDGLTTDALADFFDTDSGETSATAIDGSVVKEIMDGICTPTVFPAGAINFTYTVTDSVTTLPIEGVEVWISTDNPAVNIVWKGDTDAFGVARDVNGDLPALDAGTYYFWRQKAGYTFVDPDTEVVS